MSLYALRNIRIVVGALLAVSLFFPFITGTIAFVGYMSLNGIEKLERDAWIVVALSLGLVEQAWHWRSSVWTYIFPVLAILLSGYYLVELIGHVNEVIEAAEGTGTASLGIGIFTMVAAAIASLVLTHWVRNAEKV